ncbi:hypothetical protein GCM10027444_43570 [Actinopolyspora lacussalsi]
MLAYDADPPTIGSAPDDALLSDTGIEIDQTCEAYPDPSAGWREAPCLDT